MESTFKLSRDANQISLTPNFILPQSQRPNLSQVTTLSSIPIIDLSVDHDLVHKISQACQEFGFFQIINHGVPQDLCKRTMKVIDDFFKLPPQDRAKFFTTDFTKQVKLVNFHLKNEQDKQNVTYTWSETFIHPWDLNGDLADLLPQNPPQYREVFVEYAKEMSKLVKMLLGWMSQGLGLEKDTLESKIGQNPRKLTQANIYPPCPDPDLTLGMAVHTDFSAVTVLMQSLESNGLQVMIKDHNWVSVDPVPNAFVINIGDQLQVLSNGRYKSVYHRVITNKLATRISLAMFYEPNKDIWIDPIDELIDKEHPKVYRRYQFSEYLKEIARQKGTNMKIMEAFEFQR